MACQDQKSWGNKHSSCKLTSRHGHLHHPVMCQHNMPGTKLSPYFIHQMRTSESEIQYPDEDVADDVDDIAMERAKTTVAFHKQLQENIAIAHVKQKKTTCMLSVWAKESRHFYSRKATWSKRKTCVARVAWVTHSKHFGWDPTMYRTLTNSE